MKGPWFYIVSDAEVEGHFQPSIKDIQQSVCRQFPRVTIGDMISDRRNGEIIIPRHIAMYLARKLTPKSSPVIGKHFGKRDHTTALYAYRKIDRLRATDPKIAKVVADVHHELGCAL